MAEFISPDLQTNLLYLAYVFIITGFIVVTITSGIANYNGVSGLLGGYSAITMGILITIFITGITISNSPTMNYLSIFLYYLPFLFVMAILILLITYNSIYIKDIGEGHVENYYSRFLTASNIFLAAQLLIIFTTMKYNTYNNKNITAILSLLGVINIIIVVTIGIILSKYPTLG